MTDKVKQMLDSRDVEMVTLGIVIGIDEMTSKEDYNYLMYHISSRYKLPMETMKDLRKRAQSKHLSNIIGKR